MVMSKAFEEIINNAFLRVSNSIDSCESITELNQITDSDFKSCFILELFKFFEINYDVNVLSMYLDYLKRCNKSFVSQFLQIMQNEGV